MGSVAGGLIAVLVLGGASPAARAEAPAEEVDQLQRLYAQGRARFSASNYAGAIESFTAVMEHMALHGGDAAIRAATLFNLGTCYEKVYAVTRDVTALRQADEAFARYLEEARMYNEYTDVVEVEARLTSVKAQLAAIDGTDEDDPESTPEPPPPRLASPPDDTPADGAGEPRNKRALALTVTGGVLAGVGAGMFGMMAAGLVQGRAADEDGQTAVAENPDIPASALASTADKGKRGNALAIAGWVIGGVFVATGVVMIVVGQLAKKKNPSLSARGTSIGLRF